MFDEALAGYWMPSAERWMTLSEPDAAFQELGASSHDGSEQLDFDTSNHSLSHELGSE